MRRITAMLLSIILFVGVLQGIPTFAATNSMKADDKLGFQEMSIEIKDNKGTVIQKAQGIQYSQWQLQLVEELLLDEVTMKWKLGDATAPRNGTYVLDYYIESGTKEASKIYQVKITYELAGTTDINVNIEVLDDKGNPVQTKFTTYKPSYGDTDIEKVEDTLKSTHKINMDPSALTKNKELVVAVGNLTKVKMFFKDYEMHVSVTGIKKDYITPFTLTYDSGVVGADKEESSFNAFKGIQEFKILPTHLTTEADVETDKSLKLPSQTVVDLDKVVAEGELGVEAGSRPGIVVTLTKPMTLVNRAGSLKFESIDNVTDSTNAQQAEIYLEELLGKDISTGDAKQIKVKFKLRHGEAMVDTIDGKEKGKVISNGNRFELYFAKDLKIKGLATEEDLEYLFEWPHLQEGMLINGEIAFGGHLFGDPTKNLTFKPDKVGYTYVRYTIYRLTTDDISFKVEPYNIRGPVSYTLLKEGLLGVGWDAVDVRHYQDKPLTEQITLTTKKGAYEKYKIVMTTGSDKGEFESQIVKYNGRNDIVPPPYSEILNIDNVYVIPDDFTKDNPTSTDVAAVGIDLEWSAPEKEKLNSYLKDGDIYYEIYLSDSPNKIGKPIKVFKAFLEGSDIKLTTHAGEVKGETIYDSSRGSFIAPGIVLKDETAPLNEWEVLDIPEYEGNPKYPTKDKIVVKNEAKYEVPNTYYLTVRPVYEKRYSGEGVEPKLAISKYSNPKSLSLDIVKRVVPTPEIIQSKPQTASAGKGEQILYFNPVDLTTYVKYMLNPLGLKLHNLAASDEQYTYYRNYEIYIYQTTPDSGSSENVPFNKTQEIKSEKNEEGMTYTTLSEADRVFMREQNGALLLNYESTQNALTGEQNLHELKIKGLESNTPYYIQIRTRIDLYKGEEPLGKSVYSVFSKIHSFTTQTKPVPPTTDEQVPPAPEKFFIESQPNNTTVKIGWEESEFALSHKDKTYYQLVRSDGTAMIKEHTNRLLDIEDVLGKNSKYKGFHTKDTYIQAYNKGAWIEHTPRQGSQFLRLEENTLLPNTTYYYYIRTVYENLGEKVYSDWIMLPVTTSPVNPPINLKVEPQSAFKYDGQHETVISFLAPIPQGSKVPEDFSFDIAVKGEKDEDYRLDYEVSFVQEETSSKEYRRFVYKIKGLTHGTRYDIKVRIVDKTGEALSTSLYSEKVTARTDFSEDDQDEENAFNKYLEQYDREAEKLKRNPYWEVESSKYEEIYKYRGSYIQSELAAFKTYELVSNDTGSSVYYYVPSTFFNEAVKNNTLVTIQLDKYTATLRPNMLKDNEDIKEAQERVKKGKYQDYYVGIEFRLIGLTGRIQGDYVISPEISMNLEIVYLNKEELIIEDTIMNELLELIDDGREDVVKDLEKYVVGGKIDDAKLNSIIDKAITWVKNKHLTEVQKILKKVIEKDADIYEIQTPIYLEATLDAYEANAYYHDGSRWESVYAYNIASKLALEMDRLGSYAFTGKSSSTVLVPDIPGGSSLISKYTLSDFFDVEKGLNQTVTREKVYGAVARVLGARRGTDYTLYLKDRGVKLIVPNNMYQPIRQDEAIYIIMQAYEKMYYKDINTITVSNKLKVSNIGAFQTQYRPYVYAAVELGVVVPESNKVLPSKVMTAKEIIYMLTKIVPK